MGMTFTPQLVFRWVVYACSVWISVKYANSYWIVGPVFGMAVVSYDSNSFRNLAVRRHTLYLVASTLIYALVYRISISKWDLLNDRLEYFIGPFPIAVVVGSILLPRVHRILFIEPAFKSISVTLALVASFYVVTLFSFFNDVTGLNVHFNFLAVSIAVWQGLYLYLFFRRRRS